MSSVNFTEEKPQNLRRRIPAAKISESIPLRNCHFGREWKELSDRYSLLNNSVATIDIARYTFQQMEHFVRQHPEFEEDLDEIRKINHKNGLGGCLLM